MHFSSQPNSYCSTCSGAIYSARMSNRRRGTLEKESPRRLGRGLSQYPFVQTTTGAGESIAHLATDSIRPAEHALAVQTITSGLASRCQGCPWARFYP
jgi:hypothetical protein